MEEDNNGEEAKYPGPGLGNTRTPSPTPLTPLPSLPVPPGTRLDVAGRDAGVEAGAEDAPPADTEAAPEEAAPAAASASSGPPEPGQAQLQFDEVLGLRLIQNSLPKTEQEHKAQANKNKATKVAKLSFPIRNIAGCDGCSWELTDKISAVSWSRRVISVPNQFEDLPLHETRQVVLLQHGEGAALRVIKVECIIEWTSAMSHGSKQSLSRTKAAPFLAQLIYPNEASQPSLFYRVRCFTRILGPVAEPSGLPMHHSVAESGDPSLQVYASGSPLDTIEPIAARAWAAHVVPGPAAAVHVAGAAAAAAASTARTSAKPRNFVSPRHPNGRPEDSPIILATEQFVSRRPFPKNEGLPFILKLIRGCLAEPHLEVITILACCHVARHMLTRMENPAPAILRCTIEASKYTPHRLLKLALCAFGGVGNLHDQDPECARYMQANEMVFKAVVRVLREEGQLPKQQLPRDFDPLDPLPLKKNASEDEVAEAAMAFYGLKVSEPVPHAVPASGAVQQAAAASASSAQLPALAGGSSSLGSFDGTDELAISEAAAASTASPHAANEDEAESSSRKRPRRNENKK